MSPVTSDGTHRVPSRDWQVLLVGGASGVGKTSVARELARRFDVSLSQVDGYRLMLERSTVAENFPAIHGYRSPAGAPPEDPEELCARWINVAHEVSRALEIVVAFHAATMAAVVLEGDTILPALGVSRVLAGVPVVRRVRSVFLHEPNESRLGARLAARDRGYQLLSAADQRRELRRNMAYGEWLAGEAERHGCPVIVPIDGPDGVGATTDRVMERLMS
jgi:2-phosphoglycerate kinase